MSHSHNYHLFSLPPELLVNLTVRNLLAPTNSAESEQEPELGARDQGQPTTSDVHSCNVCLGARFKDLDDQRTHFRSDWHRYNVKARLGKGKTVNEEEFANLVDDLEDSLSGSASSSSDDESDTDRVKTLLSKSRIRSRSPSPSSSRLLIPRTALAWFHSPPSTQLGIYRAIFHNPADVQSQQPELQRMQASPPEGRRWAMFMVAGGHFAGVIVRVSKPSHEGEASRSKKQRSVPEMEILRHKTFHRYTTRRKQGGSQSLNDNSKGNAKSAGAQLRRYGEQALRDDIRNLLAEWTDDIATCERIWIRASTSNKRIFYDYDAAVFTKNDVRLRTFPFPTRRPTQSELSRCLLELTRVKITHYTEQQLQEQDKALLDSLPKPRPVPKQAATEIKVPEKKTVQLTKEEELFRDKWFRLLDMVKKGRLDALKQFWGKEGEILGGVNEQIPDWAGERTSSTLLQLASSSGQEEVLAWLLDDLGADPTILVASNLTNKDLVDSEEQEPTPAMAGGRRTAYDLAATRAIRDVFRRSAGINPDKWDWLGAAHVPSFLSKDMEEERQNKQKTRRKGLKDKIKEREATAKERTPSPVQEEIKATLQPDKPPRSGPQKLGGDTKAAEGLAGLTPEMRAKVERERRARAAEARLRGR